MVDDINDRLSCSQDRFDNRISTKYVKIYYSFNVTRMVIVVCHPLALISVLYPLSKVLTENKQGGFPNLKERHTGYWDFPAEDFCILRKQEIFKVIKVLISL